MPVASTSLPPDETSELEIKSILLLDDDELLADTLKLLLESHNFVVTVVNNGLDGLREVMNLDFDVIICDMLMPQATARVMNMTRYEAKGNNESGLLQLTQGGSCRE